MLVITDMRGRCANVAAAAPTPASYPPGIAAQYHPHINSWSIFWPGPGFDGAGQVGNSKPNFIWLSALYYNAGG